MNIVVYYIHHYACSTEEPFLQYFLVIINSYQNILKTCFFITCIIVCESEANEELKYYLESVISKMLCICMITISNNNEGIRGITHEKMINFSHNLVLKFTFFRLKRSTQSREMNMCCFVCLCSLMSKTTIITILIIKFMTH